MTQLYVKCLWAGAQRGCILRFVCNDVTLKTFQTKCCILRLKYNDVTLKAFQTRYDFFGGFRTVGIQITDLSGFQMVETIQD